MILYKHPNRIQPFKLLSLKLLKQVELHPQMDESVHCVLVHSRKSQFKPSGHEQVSYLFLIFFVIDNKLPSVYLLYKIKNMLLQVNLHMAAIFAHFQ